MMTYKNLYCALVRSMSEAIDLYDEGKGILARETLHKALLDAEEQVISHDIIPDEPISSAASAENSKARRAQQCRARRQSAAVLPSHAPHDSKARLQLVTTRRDSWRSHVHRTYTPQAAQSFKPQTANVRGRGGRPLVLSLGGYKGGYSL